MGKTSAADLISKSRNQEDWGSGRGADGPLYIVAGFLALSTGSVFAQQGPVARD